ncbi:hypothetical protein KFU94_43775 [Chloroflexi bacterium TSY]|nr:hypothetical protein [Chloroflexi bacterium TSY]
MIPQTLQNPEKPYPIQERVGLGIFTDREREMDSLMEWAEMVAQKYGHSQALVSHRRVGKTAIMERFYNQLFWEREDVMPFYFEIHDGIRQIWMKELAELYLYSFLQQFLAFRTRDAGLAFSGMQSFDHLYDIAEKSGETLVMQRIDWWKKDTSVSDALKINAVLKNLPHDFAVITGLSIIVMFDEFQRLNQVLYYDEALTHQCLNYTDSFSGVAASVNAPMLIAGSQVTILTEEALTGAMLGRVTLDYIERLPLSGAAELVLKFAQRRKWNISLRMAYIMSRLVSGHPYYIWCLFHSKYRERDLTTEEGIKNTLTFEVENRTGHINEFWRYHFAQNMETFNLPYARQMVFYLTHYGDTEVRVEKLVEDLQLPLTIEEANETLRKLIWCDLARERGDQFYGGLSDPLLGQMIRIEYSWEIERLTRGEAIEKAQTELAEEILVAKDELIAKLRGELNQWVGRIAETFIEQFMKRHFNNQTVDGTTYFNEASEITLPTFSHVYTTVTQPQGVATHYQIDLYAIPQEMPVISNQLSVNSEEQPAPNNQSLATSNQSPIPNPQSPAPWIVEIKNWQQPVNQTQVQHFWQAAQHLAKDKGHDDMVCWFYARSGFTGPAKGFMQTKGMYYTDEAGLVQMLRDFQVIEGWNEESE